MGTLNNDINVYLNPENMKDLEAGKTVCFEEYNSNHLIKIVKADDKWAHKKFEGAGCE